MQNDLQKIWCIWSESLVFTIFSHDNDHGIDPILYTYALGVIVIDLHFMTIGF